MTIFYRLTENWMGYDEGSCITEAKFKQIMYLDKPLFEPIMDYQIKDMLKWDGEVYCSSKGIEFILFYTPVELELFLNKNIDNGFAD